MRTETKIGLLILAALAVLFYFLVKMGNLSSLFEPKGYEISAYFQSIAGLEERSPVRLAGVKIGYVEKIKLDRGKALVVMKIYQPYKIRKGSKAAVTSMGIMGEKYIEIFPGEGPDFLKPGERIEGIPPLSIDQLGAMFYSIAQDVKKMSRTFSDVIGGEKGKASLNTILQNLDRITTELDRMLRLNQGNITAASKELLSALREMKRAIMEFSSASRQVASLSSSLNSRTEKFDRAMEEATRAARRISELAGKIQGELEEIDRGSLGQTLRDREIYEKTKEILDNTSEAVKKINRKMSLSFSPYLFYSSEGTGKAGVKLIHGNSWLSAGITNTDGETSYDLVFGRNFGPLSLSAGMIEGGFGLRGTLRSKKGLFLGAEAYRPHTWNYRLLFGLEKKGLLFFGGYGSRKSLIFGIAYGY